MRSRGLCKLSTATTRPGDRWSRPTRLVAWMYSAAVFGWPCTTISPSRSDVEANGDHVGRKSDIDRIRSIAAEDRLQALFRLRHIVGRDARGQFHRLLDLTIGKWAVLGIEPPPLGSVTRGAIPHFILDDPARAAELAQRIEVAKRRHVRIGGVRRL